MTPAPHLVNRSSIRERRSFAGFGALGLITQPQRSHQVVAITDWLKECLSAGARVLVPSIVYYEIKRELLRASKTIGIARLDAFVNAVPDRYLPLTDGALRFAAELWAQSRQAGRPTADASALDIDVLIAAQTIRLGGAPIIATTNPKHLAHFISARLWTDIEPAIFGGATTS